MGLSFVVGFCVVDVLYASVGDDDSASYVVCVDEVDECCVCFGLVP